MKKILFYSFAILFFAAFTPGDVKKVEVRESNEKIGNGSNNTLSVLIYIEDQDKVEKAWKSKLKDIGGKISTKTDIFADDCSMKAMGKNTFDVYSRTEVVKGEGVRLIVGVDLGGAYLNSKDHSEQFKVFKNFIYDFAIEIMKNNVGDELKAQEKTLSSLESDQKSLEKDNSNLKSDIEDYKKKIQKAEEDVKKNEEAQKKKKEEIAAQAKVVESVKQKLNAIK